MVVVNVEGGVVRSEAIANATTPTLVVQHPAILKGRNAVLPLESPVAKVQPIATVERTAREALAGRREAGSFVPALARLRAYVGLFARDDRLLAGGVGSESARLKIHSRRLARGKRIENFPSRLP
jgi:hypothetical protein